MVTNKQKAYLLVSLTFLLGCVVGASGFYLFSHAQKTQAKTVEDVAREIGAYANLGTEQLTQVEQILKEARAQHVSLNEQARPQHVAIRLATRKRIRDLLSEDQKLNFDRWTRDMDAKREKAEAEEKERKK
jgi:hypothetical protein